ncbi:phosphoribosyltransferase family protein [Georgenia thermotolerans]|uniref:Phosphoribosyltransferase n=1 Tax=Georgenia thermotolerans TaxID=527326 RepID=A0A7J5UPW5_9MICO|nr:phosphoribosyltransferase family protein [Georgenia thermotolerans]KAE8763983.1 phosphoribosyltransferase [Georgenia thermotolerans]
MRREDTTRFANRVAAGRQLAQELAAAGLGDVVVAGLPRGGVPVAAEVAAALGAPLDVVVVRKLGVPWQPEVAMGAVGEDGAIVLNPHIAARVRREALEAVTAREREEVERRVAAWRGGAGVDVRGRTVVLVDDGIATGATVRAAVAVLRARGVRRVILAVPVAAGDALEMLAPLVDDVVCLFVPEELYAVGAWYDDFHQVDDDAVRRLLEEARSRWAPGGGEPEAAPGGADPDGVAPGEQGPGGVAGAGDPGRRGPDQGTPSGPPEGGRPGETVEVVVPTSAGPLPAFLTVPEGAGGLVLFAHGSGSSRFSPRNAQVARMLQRAGLATALLDLLSPAEARDRALVFDIELLADRLLQATRWAGERPDLAALPLGYFGASTGAGAALWAAATHPTRLRAVVSRGGRPDLAGPRLPAVRVPTLLIVGGRDTQVLDLNRRARARLTCVSELSIVPGATHLFEEPGTLEQAGRLAAAWFCEHLGSSRAAA